MSAELSVPVELFHIDRRVHLRLVKTRSGISRKGIFNVVVYMKNIALRVLSETRRDPDSPLEKSVPIDVIRVCGLNTRHRLQGLIYEASI